MMTRSDFERLAWVFKHTTMPTEIRAALIEQFNNEFGGDHPRFDLGKFIKAATPAENQPDFHNSMDELDCRALDAEAEEARNNVGEDLSFPEELENYLDEEDHVDWKII